MITVFRSFGRGRLYVGLETLRHCNWRSTGQVSADFGGRWDFNLGKFRRDSSSCRVSRRRLSESQHLYREWEMESGMVNCVLPRSSTPPLPHSRPPSCQATHNRKSRASDPAFMLWRLAISPNPRQSQPHALASWPRNGWERSGPRSGRGQRNDNHPGDL